MCRAADPFLFPAERGRAMADSNNKRRQLRCTRCKRVEEITLQNLDEYSATTWPFCCGKIMTFEVVESMPPTPQSPPTV